MQVERVAMPVQNEIYRNLRIAEVHELSGFEVTGAARFKAGAFAAKPENASAHM
jgi:hypothetical protein